MITFKEYLINEADDEQEHAAAANPSELVNKARNVIKTGVQRLLRLNHPEGRDPSREVDAFDIIEALEVVRKMLEDTDGMSDTEGYIEEVKKDIAEFYLSGATEKESALNRRKYRYLVSVLLDPLVEIFEGVTHEEMLGMYNKVVDDAIRFVKNSDVVTSADDAFVTRRLIAKEVQRRNRVTKTVDGIDALRKKAAEKK